DARTPGFDGGRQPAGPGLLPAGRPSFRPSRRAADPGSGRGAGPLAVSVPIALVGCGYWGKNLARNFAQLEALAYLCDADPGALRAQAARYPQGAATPRCDDS